MAETVIESFAFVSADVETVWDELTAAEGIRRWHPFVLAAREGSGGKLTLSVQMLSLPLSETCAVAHNDPNDRRSRWRFRRLARLLVGNELSIRLTSTRDGDTWLCQELRLGRFATLFSTRASRNARLAALMESADALRDHLAAARPTHDRRRQGRSDARSPSPRTAAGRP